MMDDKALFTILRCAEQTDGQVGPGGMAKLLMGRDSRKLSKLKLDHLEEYGSLSLMEKRSVLEHMDYLIERGCLRVGSLFFFPMLDLTDVGRGRIKSMIQQHGLRILPEKPVSRLSDREVGPAHVCDETEFWYLFPQDLGRAQHEVIIVSPFVNRIKAKGFMKDFEVLLARGAKVRVYVRPLEGQKIEEEAILDTWESMGVDGSGGGVPGRDSPQGRYH